MFLDLVLKVQGLPAFLRATMPWGLQLPRQQSHSRGILTAQTFEDHIVCVVVKLVTVRAVCPDLHILRFHTYKFVPQVSRYAR